jgi:HAMP domain-containing protein
MLLDEHGLRLAVSDPQANRTPREGGLLLTALTEVAETTQRQWDAEGRFGGAVTDLYANPNPELWNAVASGSEGTARVGRGKGEQDVSYASLISMPWRYVATTPSGMVTAATNETMADLNRVWVMAAAAAALIALLFSVSMTRPLVRLARFADDVSMGDTNVNVDIGSNDEIGDLASAFSRMVASIRYYMRRSAPAPQPEGPSDRYDRAA